MSMQGKQSPTQDGPKRSGRAAKKTLTWGMIAVIIAVIGYFTVFHNADTLVIENGKAIGASSTWLIGAFPAADGETAYHKLATVNTPKGCTAVKQLQDPDGDAITTFFAYEIKGGDPAGTLILVQPAFGSPQQAASAAGNAESLTVNGTEGSCFYVFDGEKSSLDAYMPSPYEDACIRVTVTQNGEVSKDDLTAVCENVLAKVTPEKQLSSVAADFKLNFLDDSRWKYLANGLGVTLLITLVATALGIVLGVVVAIVRATWIQNSASMHKGLKKTLLGAADGICRVYLTVIRGTPVVIQLMIMYYVILVSTRNGVVVAMLSFGINSGAYVAEIIRGGIMSIDAGQLEAGRSLGFSYVQTMRFVIIPQAMKNVLPSLANEFIVLLKETSVAGYVAVKDLTKGGDIIRGVTYSPFMPLVAVALIYLVLVVFFNHLVGKLERRLRSSER